MTFHAFVLFVWEYDIYNRANIMIHHFIFVFFLYFFYHSFCRKDQFTVLSLKFGTQDFNWSRSTKDPVDPHWFVVVVLPCVCVLQVFLWMRYLIFSCFAILPFQNDIHEWSNSLLWGEKWTKKKMLMVLLQKHVWEPVRKSWKRENENKLPVNKSWRSHNPMKPRALPISLLS